MADLVMDLMVDNVIDRLSKVLIEESAVLSGAARHVEWIERELRSMQGFLEHIEQRCRYGDEEQPDELNEWAEKLKEVARDAKDVIETFVIKSVKRRRRGVLYWLDKYRVGKDLTLIQKRMRDISRQSTRINLNTTTTTGGVVTVTVETEASISSEASTLTLAEKKLGHILSQNLVTGDRLVKLVERVRDELGHLQKIVSNLKSSTLSRRESVWLAEVRDCGETADVVARNFIARSERWSKMGRLRKALCLYEGSAREFKKEMKNLRTQIGDALHTRLTYGVGGEDKDMQHMMTGDKQTKARSKPHPNLSLGLLVTAELVPLVVYFISFIPISFLESEDSEYTTAVYVLYVLIFEAIGAVTKRALLAKRKPESNEKKKKKKIKERKGGKGRRILRSLFNKSAFFRVFIDLLIILLSQFLPFQAVILLELSSLFYEAIAWTVNLLRSMERNLKCTQRHLALMRVFLSDGPESAAAEGLNERQKVWVGQLRHVAQNAHSLVAAYNNNNDDPKGGGRMCLSRRFKFARDINGLLKQILNTSDRKTIYGIADIQGRRDYEPEPVVSFYTEEHPPAPSYRHVRGLKEKVQSTREEMELMDALFHDVEEMMGELDRRSRIWVKQMRDIAFEIESVIDKYVTKLEHKPILIYILKCWSRRSISYKMDEIRIKIEDASRRRKIYGLVQIQSRPESESLPMVQILRPRTQPSLVAKEFSKVVGFDDDAQVLMGQLLSDEKRRCITCIVGIGGTGKTTLARLIFEDKTVRDHFECRVWVEASDCTADAQLPEKIAKMATEQIMGERWKTQDSSIDHVLETLASTRYLIVFDGIETSQQVLDTLKQLAVPDRSTACRILLTTRNADVAQHAAFVHRPRLLDDESSWVLFKRQLKVDIPPKLVKVGREIVTKCGGLPSEISDMGKLLSDKDVTHEEWSSALGKLIDRDQGPWSETLVTVNTVLPQILRRCLFYFVLFPAEFGIPVRRLVVLWVAEYLVQHAEEEDHPPEQVAERYLVELIDRNMVQIAKRKRNGTVKTCRLPSALRQLWLTKANESKFLPGHTANADPEKIIIRRVADHLNRDDIWHEHIHGDTRYDSASLRTYYKDVLSLLSFDAQEGSKPGQEIGNFLNACISSNCFLFLRVLDLERVYKPRLPNNIGRLSRLRYLGLRWTYLDSLPSSISSLLKLQTLDLKHTYIHILPCSIWKMELRHLFLSETFRSRFPPQPRVGNSLSDLQTLWGLFVDEETPVKGGLDKLVNIRKLGLACQSMSLSQDAMVAQLEAVADWIMNLEHLQSLRLKSRDEEGRPWNLSLRSLENHTNLTDVYLLGRLSSSSILSQFPFSLIELTLSHSKLEDDPMQILKDFPYLKTLCLLAESYVGKAMVCKSLSFPQLLVLKLWVLEQLEEWSIEEGAFPCLRQLEIRSCRRLKVLPDGLEHVDTLLELKLTNMPQEIFNAEEHKIPSGCQLLQRNLL